MVVTCSKSLLNHLITVCPYIVIKYTGKEVNLSNPKSKKFARNLKQTAKTRPRNVCLDAATVTGSNPARLNSIMHLGLQNWKWRHRILVYLKSESNPLTLREKLDKVCFHSADNKQATISRKLYLVHSLQLPPSTNFSIFVAVWTGCKRKASTYRQSMFFFEVLSDKEAATIVLQLSLTRKNRSIRVHCLRWAIPEKPEKLISANYSGKFSIWGKKKTILVSC